MNEVEDNKKGSEPPGDLQQARAPAAHLLQQLRLLRHGPEVDNSEEQRGSQVGAKQQDCKHGCLQGGGTDGGRVVKMRAPQDQGPMLSL